MKDIYAIKVFVMASFMVGRLKRTNLIVLRFPIIHYCVGQIVFVSSINALSTTIFTLTTIILIQHIKQYTSLSFHHETLAILYVNHTELYQTHNVIKQKWTKSVLPNATYNSRSCEKESWVFLLQQELIGNVNSSY